MTQKTVPMSLSTGILGAIDPDAYAAGTVTTGWISAADFQNFMAIVMAGTLGASATLDAKIEQATDASGTGAKDLSGAAITQLTQAGSDSDKQAAIVFSADDLDIANDFTHFRLAMTVAAATSDAGGLVIGSANRIGKAGGSDSSAVAELVTV